MPSPLRTSKALSDWLELDYFRRPSRFRRLWTWIPLGAILLSLLIVGCTLLVPGARTVYEAGPVSTAHALFNQDCGKCHTGAFQTLDRLVTGNPGVRSVPDEACLQCHSGPIHHARAVGERACATCHHEHRGRPALARVPDADCTSCHADLKTNDGKPPDYNPHITGFVGTPHPHPEFRLWDNPRDPGHLRFNHRVHLAPEGVLDVDRRQLELQQQKVKEMGGDPCAVDVDLAGHLKHLVKLECQSCHEPDEAGRYMKPINYDRHCKQCHPLAVQLVGGWKSQEARDLAWEFSKEPVAHPAANETPATVRAALRDRLSRFVLANRKTVLDGQAKEEPERPIPGPRPAPAPLARAEWDWVNRQLPQQERLLFDSPGGCLHCHVEQPGAKEQSTDIPKYEVSSIPTRWYNHSIFRHDSHRMLACAECHAAATSTRSADVLLPRIDNCRQCHHGQPEAARDDCVECHRYHDRSNDTLRGRLSIEDFTRR